MANVPKTIDEASYKKVVAFVTKHVEPRIAKIVKHVNDHFEKEGIRVGADLKWYFDQVTTKEETKDVKTKSDPK